MSKRKLAFVGIDIGTQGVRVAAMLEDGALCASHAISFRELDSFRLRQEQDPELWWRSVVACLRQVAAEIRRGGQAVEIRALTVCSTSGTVIPVDADHRPIAPAFLYSDPRSAAAGAACSEAARRAGVRGYTAFGSSSALSKFVWFHETFPALAGRVRLWLHAADFIVGRLSGCWGTTDPTNSLKTGYDVENNEWPGYVQASLGIALELLPTVVPTGSVVGTLTREVAEATGWPESAYVTAGVTDSCAAQIASGALRPGDWNTTIGTTLVVKGVTRLPVKDELGRIYNHRHPEGHWMPGGASNTGADWVALDYDSDELPALNEAAARLTPTAHLAYPLVREGERFPFISPQARGFEPGGLAKEASYTARLEGTAYIERLSYELIGRLSGEPVDHVYTAGGASDSASWLRIRSSVLGVPIRKMKHTTGAAGAAVLAASKTYFSNISEAGNRMLTLEALVEPGSRAERQRYEESYEMFLQELQRRGYLL